MSFIYTVHFKIRCPFDSFGTLPPQESEIRCYIGPDKEPLFALPSICDHCNGTNFDQCIKCVTTLHQMFQQGHISLNLDVSHPIQTLPAPIRPSLSLLSE